YILGANLGFGVAVTIFNLASNTYPGFCTSNQIAVDFPSNTWVHLAATYDAQTRVGCIYLNGQPRAVQQKPDLPGSPQGMYASTSKVLLGNQGKINGKGEGLVGNMSDVRIYNRALSSNEVQQLYTYEGLLQIGLTTAIKPTFFNLSLATNYQLEL